MQQQLKHWKRSKRRAEWAENEANQTDDIQEQFRVDNI
jgi:hypothetical protein